MSRPRLLWRAAGLVLLLAVSAVAGAVSGFVHRTTLDVAGVAVPVGMMASLAALAGLLLAARTIGGSRTAVLLVGAAYAVPVLVLSQFRPEGDLVVAENAWGLSLLGGAALVITVGVTVPVRAYHGKEDGASDGTDSTSLIGRPRSEVPDKTSPTGRPRPRVREVP